MRATRVLAEPKVLAEPTTGFRVLALLELANFIRMMDEPDYGDEF